MDDPALFQTVAERSTAEELDLRLKLTEALTFFRHDLEDGPEPQAIEQAVRVLVDIVDRQIAVAIDRAMTLMEKKAPPPPPEPKEKKPFFPAGFEDDA